MRKVSLIILVLCFILTFAIVCEAGYPLKIVDDMNYCTEITEKPLRIVSLSPSHTEVLFALGIGDRVVGRTDFCDYPDTTKNIPSVGGYSQPSLESILIVQPDLVIAAFGTAQELLDQLRELGIKVVGYNPNTLDDVLKHIWEIGKITGSEEKAAELIDDMRVRIDQVKEKVREANRPLVFWEVWHDPLYSAGPGSYIDDLINIAGGVNLASDADTPWPVYSLEVLLVKNPDIYIATKDQWSSPGNIHDRPGYDQIKAIKSDRVFVIDANNVNRPGPRLVDGLETIVRLIHPELF